MVFILLTHNYIVSGMKTARFVVATSTMVHVMTSGYGCGCGLPGTGTNKIVFILEFYLALSSACFSTFMVLLPQESCISKAP